MTSYIQGSCPAKLKKINFTWKKIKVCRLEKSLKLSLPYKFDRAPYSEECLAKRLPLHKHMWPHISTLSKGVISRSNLQSSLTQTPHTSTHIDAPHRHPHLNHTDSNTRPACVHVRSLLCIYSNNGEEFRVFCEFAGDVHVNLSDEHHVCC